MNKILIAIFMLLGLLMLTGTSLLFSSNKELLLLRESADYLSKISTVNKYTSISFLTIYLILLYFLFKKSRIFTLSCCVLIFSLWLINGRVIAFKYFPDGRILTSWYYIESDRFYLAKNELDYESLITKKTSITKLPLWRVKIKNDDIDRNIFIGLFSWKSSLATLEDIGKYSTSTEKN